MIEDEYGSTAVVGGGGGRAGEGNYGSTASGGGSRDGLTGLVGSPTTRSKGSKQDKKKRDSKAKSKSKKSKSRDSSTGPDTSVAVVQSSSAAEEDFV